MKIISSISSVLLITLLCGCTDRAIFVTSTDIGLSADASAQAVQIGFQRAELFQGPNYPDAGETPQVIGFMASDLAPFAPYVRQLYATGDAADLVTAPGSLKACASQGTPATTLQYDLCPQAPGALKGERRPLVFATDTNFGFKVGFTSGTPSSIKFGYNRQEMSIIPLHEHASGSDGQDKYTPVLASIEIKGSASAFNGTDIKSTQFFATGSAARNLAKNEKIRNFFTKVATNSVNASLVAASDSAIGSSKSDIDSYFGANKSGPGFTAALANLLGDRTLDGVRPGFSDKLKSATTLADFDAALNTSPDSDFLTNIGAAAKAKPASDH